MVSLAVPLGLRSVQCVNQVGDNEEAEIFGVAVPFDSDSQGPIFMH